MERITTIIGVIGLLFITTLHLILLYINFSNGIFDIVFYSILLILSLIFSSVLVLRKMISTKVPLVIYFYFFLTLSRMFSKNEFLSLIFLILSVIFFTIFQTFSILKLRTRIKERDT